MQQALLKLLEGKTATITPDGARNRPQQELIQIDTTNILFICTGAFNGLEDVVRRRVGQQGLGFGAKLTANELLTAPGRYTLPDGSVRDGKNEVRVRLVSGQGPLYVSARSRFFSLEEPIPPRGHQLFVKRQYYKLENSDGGPIRTEESPRAFAKLTWQTNPSNNVEAWVEWDRYDITGRGGDGVTPLGIALVMKKLDNAEALVKKGAKLTREERAMVEPGATDARAKALIKKASGG